MRAPRRWPAAAAVLAAAALVACADGGRDSVATRTDSSATPEAAERASSGPEAGARDSVDTYDPRRTDVFRCSDASGQTFRFEVRPRDGRVDLWLPGRFGERTVGLDRVRAASGARYEGNDVLYWNRGDEALLRVGEEEFRGCTMDRGGWVWAAARRRGVDFRASGNEPGWYLELSRGDSLHLEYDYGERRLTVATPEVVVEGMGDVRKVRFGTSDSALRLTIEEEPCVAVSGTEFPKTVTVDVGGTSYQGCGRWLDGAP